MIRNVFLFIYLLIYLFKTTCVYIKTICSLLVQPEGEQRVMHQPAGQITDKFSIFKIGLKY